MIIGLDMSVLQTPHRMRGVGAVAREFFNNIPASAKKENKFVIYLFKDNQTIATDLLKLDDMDYEINTIKKCSPINIPLPGKLKKINGIFNGIRDIAIAKLGENKLDSKQKLDAYVQFDQMIALPKLAPATKKILILYDIIPYVLKDYYLWDYKIARKNGRGVLSALRSAYLRYVYKVKLKANCQKADKLIAISKHTKEDFVRYMGANSNKIDVSYLGVDDNLPVKAKRYPGFKQYTENSWGYIKKDLDLRKKPYLLFIGGIDPRRRMKDLIAAYNIVRAMGKDIRLVLAGDIMVSPNHFPEPETQKYVKNSSYINDIVFLGYVNEEQKQWLYNNALVFIYPSIYEGFGLPILEAMHYGTPVITYNNTSISEIAGDATIYANDASSIASEIITLLSDKSVQEAYHHKAVKQAKRFTWNKTARSIIDIF